MKRSIALLAVIVLLAACAPVVTSPTPQVTNQEFYRGYYALCLGYQSQQPGNTEQANETFCLALTRKALDAKVDSNTPGWQWPLPNVTSPKISSPSKKVVPESQTFTIYLPLVESSCSWNYINWAWTQPVTYDLLQDVLNCYHLLYPFNSQTGTYTDQYGNPAPPLCPPANNPWDAVFNTSNCYQTPTP